MHKFFLSAAVLAFCLGGVVHAGYSPCTNFSSDDGACDGEEGRHWNHHLNQYEREEAADPTAALELDSDWAGDREEFSDTLYPILR